MKESVFIFLSIYATFGIILFIGSLIQSWKEKKFIRNSEQRETIQLSDLTVIIPFRNERNRIEGLLKSINESILIPKQFIFVDDHSEDGTADFVRSILITDKYQLINANQTGKKAAIAQAIQFTKTSFILTFDADITFHNDYFSHLEKLIRKDMLILPVIMNGKGWKQVFEIDVDFTNAVNYCVSGLTQPIVASGANLLFSKSEYEKWNRLDEHQHFASGDDVFLLNNFKKNNCSIQLIADKRLAVSTPTPASFNEYFDQRLRWISKTSAINDSVGTFLAIAQVLFTLSFLAILVLLIVKSENQQIIYLIFFKYFIDCCATLKFYFQIGKLHSNILLAIHQIWTPILSIVLAVGMIFHKPKWKGRAVRN